MKPRWLLEATGASLLLLLPYFCPLILPRNISLYHHLLPVTNIVSGLLLDLLGAAVLAAALIFLFTRLPPLPRRIAAACLAGLVCWRAVGVFSTLVNQWNSNLGSAPLPHGYGFDRVVAHFWSHWLRLIAVLLLPLCAALAWLKPEVSRAFVKAARFGLAAFAFCVFWIVPKLIDTAFARPVNTVLARVSVQPRKSSSRRIVWVLFDELSDNLLFDHRPPGLETPNFERLYSESTSFGDLQPVGYYTDRVIPSLLAGVPIHQIGSTSDGSLLYFNEARHRWLAYNAQQTLFGLARSDGWNPGVAGWYIPYCRTFAPVLTNCSWVPGIQSDLSLERDGASEAKSGFRDALILPAASLAGLTAHAQSGRVRTLDQNIQDYRQVMKDALALVANDQIHFVFLHLPVPHPPGFFNRQTHQLSASGDYLDNLVLADETLGVLEQAIARTPAANQTTLIVSSDHSWRVPMWKTGHDWTPEEERISGGRFDPRPVLLIHFPGQRSGQAISAPLPELIEHGILAAMLDGQLKDEKNLGTILRPPARLARIAMRTTATTRRLDLAP